MFGSGGIRPANLYLSGPSDPSGLCFADYCDWRHPPVDYDECFFF
jgi:hypothetical protein